MNNSTSITGLAPVGISCAVSLALALAHGSVVAAGAEAPQAAAPAAQAAPLKARAGKSAPAQNNTVVRTDSGPRCTGEAARPAKMSLFMGKSTLMRLPEPVVHRSVGDASVVQAMLVAPDTLYLLGVDVGTTNMIIQGKSGACSVVDLNVQMDPAALQDALAIAMPEEKNIKVTTAAESLVLTGTVSDAAAVQRAYELAVVFMQQPLHALLKQGDDAGTAVSSSSNNKVKYPPSERIVNMLSVTAPQQVLLEVKIAEVSKSLLERLEGSTTFRFSSGSWATTLLSNFLSGPTAAFDARKSNGNRVAVDANKQDGLVRILAEPNVMAISGQEGSFLAGGKIFIPVAQDNNKITLEEKEFGVGLRFTPTVLSGGRINLRVAPEVSEISREGIGIQAAGFTGAAVLPLITTRRASTTVQLYDGQSFAIGGLIKNNMITNLNGLPLAGEIPVLGALFRSTDFQHDRTELVFVVTAHLVKPLPPNYSLPTDSVIPPGRAELMLMGRLEGKAPPTAAANPPAAPAAPAGASVTAEPERQSGFELK